MNCKATILVLTVVLAAPAWAQRGGGGRGGGFSGGGHGGGRSGGSAGGGRAGGSGGHGVPAHTVAPAHIGAGMAVAPRAASALRPAGGTFTGGPFITPLASPTTRVMQHLPNGTMASRPAPAAIPSHLRVGWTTSTARMMMPGGTTRAALPVAPARPAAGMAVIPARAVPIARTAFLVGTNRFVRSRGAFFFFGSDCFFSPFFANGFAVDPFLANPFCPFCATGRLLNFNGTIVSPFVRRRFFFRRFFPGGFFPGFGLGPAFGTGFFLDGVPVITEPVEQVPAGETSMPAEEAAPPSPGGEQATARPITLLFLKTGWMYGVTEYWVEGDRLHYITTYGGENSVPLGQIDFARTVQLNAERDVEFVLRPKPQPR
jgi:hypothetical protein